MTDPDTALRDYDRVCEENARLQDIVKHLSVSLTEFMGNDAEMKFDRWMRRAAIGKRHFAKAAEIAEDLDDYIDITMSYEDL